MIQLDNTRRLVFKKAAQYKLSVALFLVCCGYTCQEASRDYQ